MRFPIPVPGAEGRSVEVVTSTLGGGARVLIDGLPATKGSKRGEFLVPRPDGQRTVVQLTGPWFDSVPRVAVDGVPHVLAEPLKVYEQVLIALPIVLMFIGGGIGGLCAGLAVTFNMFLFRTTLPRWVKVTSALVLFVAAFWCWETIAIALRRHWEPSVSGPTFFHPAAPSPTAGPSSGPTPPGFVNPPNVPAQPGFPPAPNFPGPPPGFPPAPPHP